MQSESIDRYIEDQAFSLSYDLAPPPLFPVCKARPATHIKTEQERQLAVGGGGGGGPNHTTARKPDTL